MTITYRGVKDEALTYAEVDENFRDLLEDTDLERVLGNGNSANVGLIVPYATVAGANVTLSFQGSNNWTNASIVTLNAYLSGAISNAANAANSYAASVGLASNNYVVSVGTAANNWSNTKLANASITVSGGLKMSDIHLLSNVTVTLSTNVGNVGQVSWDGNYLYVCVAPNQWKRTQLLSW